MSPLIQLSPLAPTDASPKGGRPTGKTADADRFAALLPGKRQPTGKIVPLPLPDAPDLASEGDCEGISAPEVSERTIGSDTSVDPLFATTISLLSSPSPHPQDTAEPAPPANQPASFVGNSESAPTLAPLIAREAGGEAGALDNTGPVRDHRSAASAALPSQPPSDLPVSQSARPDTAAPILHPQDNAKVVAALAGTAWTAAPATKPRTPALRAADPLSPDLTPRPSTPDAVLPALPVAPVMASTAAPSDRPARPDHAPTGEALGQMLEHVEFGRAHTGGTATHLRVVHEAVGRLSITIESAGAGGRADLQLGSDDAGVRHALAEAVPGLMRLAEERRLDIGSVGIGVLGTAAREGDQGSSPRHQDGQPARAPAPSPSATPRSTGLFA